MGLSAREAAKEAGKAVTTITRAIESGKLTASRLDGGGYDIDPAELFRAFPPKRSETSPKLHDATPQSDGRNSGLERLVETLQEQLRDLREDREGWKQEAENWRQQAERLTLLLPSISAAAPPSAPDAPATGQGSPVRGFWSRLLGRVPSND